MIHGEFGLIRSAEPDDAIAFQNLYDPTSPRSALLSRVREFMAPTRDEVRQLFKKRNEAGGVFYVIEDKEGIIRGFCSLRSTQELRDTAFLAEIVLLFHDYADYQSPLAQEVFDWMRESAFGEQRLNKLIAHGLEGEPALREWLRSVGFESCGIQRDVFHTAGKWQYLETFNLFNPDRSIYGPGSNPSDEEEG